MCSQLSNRSISELSDLRNMVVDVAEAASKGQQVTRLGIGTACLTVTMRRRRRRDFLCLTLNLAGDVAT